MGGSHYIANTGIASASFLPELPVVATLPCAISPVITPTYANQVLKGSQVVMELGTPEAITAALAGKELYAAKERAEQLEARIKELHKTTGHVWDNRALPFLAYLEQRGRVTKSSQVLAARVRSGNYTPQDTTQLIGTFLNSFPQNLTGGLARDEIKTRLMKYVAGGEFDEQLLEVLKGVDKKGFEALPAYLALVDELKGVAQPEAAVSALEEAVRCYKANNDVSETLTFLGRELNIAQAIEGLIGVKPARHFLLTIDRLVGGEVKDGIVSPFQFKPNGKGDNVPEELKSQCRYLSMEKLGQIITVIDSAIYRALELYAYANEELRDLFTETFNKRGREPNLSVFMRVVFPDDHVPTLTLYPNWRLQIDDARTRARIVELARNGRAEIPKVVASHLGMTEDQFNFEGLVAVQSQIMQLLPMPIYECAAIDSMFSRTMGEAKRQLSRTMGEAKRQLSSYDQRERVMILRYSSLEKQLIRDFAVTLGKVFDITDVTIDEAVELFGEEKVGLLKKIRLVGEASA